MKNIVNNLKNFFDVEVFDEENAFIYSHFFLLDTNTPYPINIKKLDNDEILIHDGGAIVHFLDENDLVIDRENILKLSQEYANLSFYNGKSITYKGNIKTIAFDIAKFIQIITKITN